MIKGIEALTLECFLAAARAGVLDAVTVSLGPTIRPRRYTGRDQCEGPALANSTYETKAERAFRILAAQQSVYFL